PAAPALRPACPAAATGDSGSSPPVAPRIWPADDGRWPGPAGSTLPIRFLAPAVLHSYAVTTLPGADTTPPSSGALPLFCSLLPAPQLATATLLRSGRRSHTPRPAGQDHP